MAFRWACDRCGQLHGTNPSRCVNCRGTVFTPVSKSKVEKHGRGSPKSINEDSEPEFSEDLTYAESVLVEQRTTDSDTPSAIDPDSLPTMGTRPEPDYQSSPDVRPDGSIETGAELETTPDSGGAEPPSQIPILIFLLMTFAVLGWVLIFHL